MVVTMVTHEGWVVLAVVVMVHQLMEEPPLVPEQPILAAEAAEAVNLALHKQTAHKVVLAL